MLALRIYAYSFMFLALALSLLVFSMGRVIGAQHDLIRQMETNPKCLIAPTGGSRG